jgi:hypothetical protein
LARPRQLRRSVLTRSPGRLGINDGATTAQSWPSPVRWRWIARTGLVAEAQPPALARQRLDQLAHRLRAVGNLAEIARLPAVAALGHRNRDRLFVNVRTNVCGKLLHDPSHMHEASHRTIRRNPRHLHTVRRVTPSSIGHGVLVQKVKSALYSGLTASER